MSDVGHGKLGLRSGLQDFEDLIDESASRKDITVELRPVKEITDWTLDQSNTYVAPIELIYNGVRRDIVAIKSLLDLGPLTRVETVALCRSTSGSYYYDVDEDFGQTAMWDDGVSIWQVNGVTYDGSSDYLTRGADLTGAADSKVGLASFWVRIDGADGTGFRIFTNSTNRCNVTRSTGDTIQFQMFNGAASRILNLYTDVSVIAGTGWHHIMASWNLATTTSHLYLDGVSAKTEQTITDDTIDYTAANWAVGASAAGADKLDGALAETYFALEYMDLSVEANRLKFIDADGKPVDLGGDGALPTGTTPILYLPGPAAAVNVNEGSGGDFTINGAPAETGTSPPDDDAHLLWDQFPQLYVHLGDDSDPADTTVVAALSFHYAARAMTHPDLGPDKFTNGSLDDWTSGDLDTWVGTGAGSEAEETTEIKSGSAAKLTVTGVQDRTESQSLTTFVADRLYRYSGYYYTDGDVDAQIVVADGVVGRQWVVPGHGFINATNARQWVLPGHGMINEVGAVGLQSDGRTEEAAGLAHLTLDRTGGEWRRFCFDFRAFNATQRLIFRALGDGGTSGTVYFDEVEVRRIWRYHQHEPRLSQRSIPAISSGSNDIFFGGKRITSGAIKLDNTDGNIEELIPQLEWINQDIYVRYGGEFQDGQEILIDDYRKALTGLIQRLETTDADATFQLLDVRTFFHIILPTRVYDDLTFSNLDTAGFLGKPRPILFGVKENITPARIDLPADDYGKYEICDCTDATNGIKAIDNVYAYADKEAADAKDSTRRKTLVEGTDYTEDLANGQFTVDKDCGPYEITTENNWIIFHDAVPPLGENQADLTVGLYTADGLAAHVQTQMDAETGDTITCTYDDPTHLFTIASDGGTFVLHVTHEGLSKGAYPLLGFKSSEDKTGATSYTSDNVTFSDADKDHILRVDAQGYKDDAGGTYTGTGSAIVEVGSDICYYIMNRFMRKAASIRDITSFEAARSRAAEALCIYLDESTSTKKVFDSLEYSNVANISVDGNGTVFYEIYIGEIPADIITLEDRDILQFAASKSGQDVYSTIRVLYDEDPSTGVFEARESSDAGVGVRLGRPEAREFETYLKLADNAISVSGRMLELARTTARKIKITVRGGRMMRLRVGNKFKLTRRRAMDLSGRLREEVFRIISLSKNILTGECVIEATDDRITVASNACILACQSFCESACQELCQQSCQENCEISCMETCEASCQENCQQNCQENCMVSCMETCEAVCQDSCEASCQGSCEGGGCQTACKSGPCQTACETICQDSCEASCQASCQVSCMASCQISCQVSCQVSCQESCQVSCMSGCELNCQENCELFCQTPCESTCQTASERVV